MKGTNNPWNMCITQCIVNGQLFRAKLVKGDNYVRYEIVNNEKMLFTPNHSKIKITLHLYQAILATSKVKICPEIFKGNQCVRVTLSNNKPEVCIKQAR